MLGASSQRDDDLARPASRRGPWWRFGRTGSGESAGPDNRGRRRKRERPAARANRRDRGESVQAERDLESGDRVGRVMEAFARGMGTPMFLILLTVFCALWILWNAVAPEALRFDSAELGFTALTLMLSLQASYAAPMLLLAQNRQDDRDRVQIAQDRDRAERNTADLEYLAREIVALRMLVNDMASKDFIRSEVRGLLEDLEELEDDDEADDEAPSAEQRSDSRRARAADGDEYRGRDASEQRRRAKVRKQAEAAEQARSRQSQPPTQAIPVAPDDGDETPDAEGTDADRT